MIQDTLLELNICEIRERVLLEVRRCRRTGRPWRPSRDLRSRQIEFLLITYVAFAHAFGIPPWPDMLLSLGWPGQVIHALFCDTAGMWEAFRELVESYSNLPRQTPRNEGDVILHSVPERCAYRALVAMSGITRVEPHPAIPGGPGRHRADFRLIAITGLTVYVEVAMVASQADADDDFRARYRGNLLDKLALYEKEGLEPIVIWADELASPRVLAERLNDIRARLNLPTRPPAPLAWWEEIV